MSLRELISKILEKNIGLFENEYENILKNLTSNIINSRPHLLSVEKIDEELKKLKKSQKKKKKNGYLKNKNKLID